MGTARALAFVVSAACVLLAGYLLSAHSAERHLQRANEAGLRGDYVSALAEAAKASGATTRGRAELVEAYALAGLGRFVESARRFRAAARDDPRNWALHRDWARVLLSAGRRAAARAQMAVALGLNPRMALPPGFSRGPDPNASG